MTEQLPFQKIVDALTAPTGNFPSRHLTRFSDISPAELNLLLAAWPQIPVKRKLSLLQNLNEIYQEDTLLSFEDLAKHVLTDNDPQVRALALRLLYESGDEHLVPQLVGLVMRDESADVRTEAAIVLGLFVRMGELEELADEASRPAVEEALLAAARDDSAYVRRAALVSLGYSSREEVPDLIAAALENHDALWISSALLAISRSAEGRWQDVVLAYLKSDDPGIRSAAAQAAGELGLAPARRILLNLLEDEEDADAFQAIVWALSQIGGEDVRTYIESLLDQTEDDDEIDFLEEALMNLEFTEDAEDFDMISFAPDDDLHEVDPDKDE